MPEQLEVGKHDIDIQALKKSVENGDIVLPDFQRDFIWKTTDIGALLESILKGYYINTLLFISITSEDIPFDPRLVEGVPKESVLSENPTMVLDGQQRVTSIYYALTAPENLPLKNTDYAQLFYLKWNEVLDGNPEDAVDWRPRSWGSSKQLIENNYEVQMEKGKIPFTIFKDKDSYDEWRFGLEDYAENNGSVTREEVRNFDRKTSVFRNYEIPVMQLDKNTSTEKVVRTFEKINTTGMNLGIFDILTARLYPEVNLRDLWDDAIDGFDKIEKHSETVGIISARKQTLKTLALYRGEECGKKSLGKLKPEGFESDWNTTLEVLDRVLEKAKSSAEGGFGVTEKYGFPYSSILPTLANLIYLAEEKETYPNQKALRKIQKWYWTSLFSKRYSGSTDTISYRDYNQMKKWIEEDELPEAIEDSKELIPISLDLDGLTRGGQYKGVMSLIVLNGARDFNTGESIDIHPTDDHHIFPKSQLKSGLNGTEYEGKEIDRILNRTLIQYEGNRYDFKGRLPSDYVRDMIEEHSEGEVKEILQDHFIDNTGFEAMLEDDYETFCEARKERIREEIENRTGMDIDWTIQNRE